MPSRNKTMTELSEIIGYSTTTLYRHRDGSHIVFDDGRRIKVSILGGKIRVPDIEIARFLGETESSVA